MDAHRSCHLCDSADRLLNVPGSDHHQVVELVDHDEYVGELVVRSLSVQIGLHRFDAFRRTSGRRQSVHSCGIVFFGLFVVLFFVRLFFFVGFGLFVLVLVFLL